MSLISQSVGIIVFVGDLEASTAFYQDVLGLSIWQDVEHDDPAGNRIVAVPEESRLHYRVMTIGENRSGVVCLFEVSGPAPAAVQRGSEASHNGEACLCVSAPDLDPIMEKLLARAHPVLCPPTLLRNPDGRRFREMTFRDLDGAMVNVMETGG